MQASYWGAECMSMLLLLLASSCPSLQTGGLQAGAFFLSLLGVALPLLKVCMHTHEPSRDVIRSFIDAAIPASHSIYGSRVQSSEFIIYTDPYGPPSSPPPPQMMYEGALAPCGVYFFMCIDGKART